MKTAIPCTSSILTLAAVANRLLTFSPALSTSSLLTLFLFTNALLTTLPATNNLQTLASAVMVYRR